jgi:glycosyltransferase involved in cell wall biosynthesis
MKVVIVTQMDIFENLNYGGVIEANRHYQMCCDIYGKEEVGVIIVTSDNTKKSNDRIKYIYQKHSTLDVVINCLALRVEMDKKTEKNIAELVDLMNAEIVFFEASFWYRSLKLLKKNRKTIVFMHNIEKNYAWNRVKYKSILTLPRYFACSYNEKKILKEADKVICLTDRDSSGIKKMYGRNADMLLPITFQDQFNIEKIQRYEKSEELQLLFVGSNFPPNAKGILWFVEKVMPKLKNCHLTIVGKGMEEYRNQIENDKITVVGTVNNTSEYYYKADAMVMPIFWGDGMKLKTAEAMMYGKMIFATTEALVGYDIEKVTHIYTCNNENEFEGKINQVIDGKKYTKFYEDVRDNFLAHYETKQLESEFQKFMKGI